MEFSSENKGEELLNVSVEIAPGQKGVIRVFEHDDIQLVVRNFFIKNNIVDGDEDLVLRRVNEFMEELIEEHKLINQALAGMPNFTSPICKNFGERLYRKCMEQKEIKIVKNQMERIWKARKVQEGLQDRPKIDKKSASIVCSSMCKSLSTIKCQSSEVESSVLRFSPKLKEIKESTKDQLSEFNEPPAQRRKTMELKPLQSQEFEIPSTNSSTQKRKSQNFDPPSSTPKVRTQKTQEFLPLSSDIIKSQALLKVTQHIKIGIDQETGSKVFQAVQTNNPQKDYKKMIIHNRGFSKPTSENSISPVKAFNNKSSNTQSSKQKRYLDIFFKLKQENEDKIDPDLADLSKVNMKLAKILLPLLIEMKKNEVKADFGEFSMRMDSLLKNLNPVDRNVVLIENRMGLKSQNSHKKNLSMGSFKTHASIQNSFRKSNDPADLSARKTPQDNNRFQTGFILKTPRSSQKEIKFS